MVLILVRWLPSRRAPVILCSSSIFDLEVAFFALAGVGIFGLLGVRFVLVALVHEGLAV